MTSPFGQMATVSSNWMPAMQASVLNVRAYAEIWSAPNFTTGTQTKLAGPIPVIAGSVSIDRNNQVRRTATNITLLPDSGGNFMPQAATNSGWLTPYGNEMRIYKGCVEPSVGTEYVSLGYFMISGVDVINDSNGVRFQGTMKDRAAWWQRRAYSAPYALPGGLGLGTVLLALLSLVGVPYSVAPFPYSFAGSINSYIPAATTINLGDDPWQLCQDAVTAFGFELFYDYQGVLQCQFLPPPATTGSCATYTEGTSTAPTTIKRAISNDNVPNVICVVAQGSNVAFPAQCWWWDSNTSSPTFYANAPILGWTNPVPTLNSQSTSSYYPTCIKRLDTSQLTASTLAAEQALLQQFANAQGLLAVGQIDSTTITIRDNPAHDVDDVITVGRVVAGIPTSSTYVIDQVQIDLDPKQPLQMIGRPVA